MTAPGPAAASAAPPPTTQSPTEFRAESAESGETGGRSPLVRAGMTVGLGALWYALAFGPWLLAGLAVDRPFSPAVLPLVPSGWGRLLVGSFVAALLVSVLGRRAVRVVPGVVVAALIAWVLASAELPGLDGADVLNDSRVTTAGTLLLVAGTVAGLVVGLVGARRGGSVATPLCIAAAVGGGLLVTAWHDLGNAIRGAEPVSFVPGELTAARWLPIVLAGLAAVFIGLGRRYLGLVLAAIAALVAPLGIMVVGFVGGYVRSGSAMQDPIELIGAAADLVQAVLADQVIYSVPLAVLLGGLVGLAGSMVRAVRPMDSRDQGGRMVGTGGPPQSAD